MSTFYLDLEGGNDSNDGTTFANRWLTFLNGATAARIAPGDTIRVMASPDPTLIGNCSWTQNSKTITLPSSVTQMVSDCETAWSAFANVTATADTITFKEGTKSAKLVIAAGFTTGNIAYFDTGLLNLSGYQQLSFWIYNSAAVAASTLSIKLCTGVGGSVPVNSFTIPALPHLNRWTCITVDLGSALSSAILSIALYGDLDPGAVTIQLDNVIACKASSSVDSLSLTSLIGKVHNLSWVASTAYSLNDNRRPTQSNRNGYSYRVTTAGTTSSSEPTWPNILGNTVTDGSVVWTCQEYEDTWFSIQSINGTTVKLDNDTNTLANAGRGYAGITEASVATYKREAIKGTMGTGTATDIHTLTDAGSVSGGYINYQGGYDRTNMSQLSGETWYSGQNGYGRINGLQKNYLMLLNISLIKMGNAFANLGYSNILKNCHSNNNNGIGINTSSGYIKVIGGHFANNSSNAITFANGGYLEAVSCNSSTFSAIVGHNITGKNVTCLNNGFYVFNSTSNYSNSFSNLVTKDNGSGVFNINSESATFNLLNSLLNESPEFTFVANQNTYIYSQKHDQTADNHYIATDGGSIISAVDQRHTASGISWKFRPTSTNRFVDYPLVLQIEAIAVKANALVTLNVWTRRDNTNIKGRLVVKGGQIAGVPNDVIVTVEPSINTWTQSSSLTFTPTEAGVVGVEFWVHDGVDTINNYWIDDFTASQA